LHRISVVLDGVDPAPLDRSSPDSAGLRFELGLALDARLALAVGALVDHKGHRYLVRAMAHIPSWHVAIAGEGPRQAALLALAQRLGVANRLHMLGQRDDVPRLLKSVDVVVHPSVEEGMGQSVAEALLAGARVVSTDAGGLPEVVGSWGIVVPRADPTALADGIRVGSCLIPGDLRDLRARFSVDRMVSQTRIAYNQVLDRQGRQQ
jgi:glycosyltransferase involved in cell wall biosynthesis